MIEHRAVVWYANVGPVLLSAGIESDPHVDAPLPFQQLSES